MINVINFWGSDVFYEWFAPFGAKPNYIIPFSTVNGLKYASEAAATVQACSTLGSYLGAVLEQDFGVPEIPAAHPTVLHKRIDGSGRWERSSAKKKLLKKSLRKKRKSICPKLKLYGKNWPEKRLM